MSSGAERVALNLAGRGFLAVILVLVAIPGYLTLAPSWRPIAARLACTALVAAGSARLIRSARRSREDDGGAALDAPAPPARATDLDERFLRLRDELTFSVKSRRYFETILWPQLTRLGGSPLPTLPRHPRRRRGPTLAALERLVAGVERGT